MDKVMTHPLKTNGQRTDEQRSALLFEDLKQPLTDKGAAVESSRCLECGGPYAEAPCVTACPTGIDIPGFISAIYRGEIDGAADRIFEENLLGATCSKVCPVEVLCEGACVLEKEGRKPVEIGLLQRYATERELKRRIRFREPAPSNGHKVSVIGAGPAGLSCAGELALKGYDVTVYDERQDFGGLVRYAIAPYRIDRDPLPSEVQMLKDLGVKFEMGTPIDSREKLDELRKSSEAVFLGIGLGDDVNIGYPGDGLQGVWESLEFIKTIKTDRLPEIGSSVAVIGGGNTAIDVAIEARRMGAKDVTIYYRRTESEMPAYDHEIDEARSEGVHLQFLTNPVRFEGEDRVERMVCQYMQLGEPDDSGRPRPVKVENTEFAIPVDTVIKAIGQQKRTGFLSWIEDLELDNGLIKIDESTGQTSNRFFFAGGDALNGGATVVEAVEDGKVAAHGIDKYVGGMSS